MSKFIVYNQPVKTITVSLDEELHSKSAELARATGISINEFVRDALRSAVGSPTGDKRRVFEMTDIAAWYGSGKQAAEKSSEPQSNAS